MKKKSKIITITLSSVILLLCFMPAIDCYRLTNNEGAIFAFHTVNVTSFDVDIPDNENSKIIEEQTKTFTIYKDLGYSIYVCDHCKKRVTFLPLGMENYIDPNNM